MTRKFLLLHERGRQNSGVGRRGNQSSGTTAKKTEDSSESSPYSLKNTSNRAEQETHRQNIFPRTRFSSSGAHYRSLSFCNSVTLLILPPTNDSFLSPSFPQKQNLPCNVLLIYYLFCLLLLFCF